MKQHRGTRIGEHSTLQDLPGMSKGRIQRPCTHDIHIDRGKIIPKIHDAERFPVVLPQHVSDDFYGSLRGSERF